MMTVTIRDARWRRVMSLVLLAAGWAVSIATTVSPDPVEHVRAAPITLAVDASAPTTAIVDVTFEGAFADRPAFVCGRVVYDVDEPSDLIPNGVMMQIDVVEPLGRTEANSALWPLEWTWDMDVLNTRELSGCATLTCSDEPCGGRFALTLVDGATPDDPDPDPRRLEPFDVTPIAAVRATPDRLPGRLDITLVETLP